MSYDEGLLWQFTPRWFRYQSRYWLDQPTYISFGNSIGLVGDADLQPVTQLHGVRRIYLCGTDVTDEGLRYLCHLQELREVDVTNTDVTPRGIAKLQIELPNCRIIVRDN